MSQQIEIDFVPKRKTHTKEIDSGAGAGAWSGVREKYYWLDGSWKLVLEWCERKILLGWSLLELPKSDCR